MSSFNRTKNRRSKKLRRAAMILCVSVLAVAVVLLVMACLGVFDREEPLIDGLIKDVTIGQVHSEQLGHDLELESVGHFSGLYMEDGSMDNVSQIMMIRIKNTGDHDLRLARLYLTYTDAVAEFEITNLPAGRSMVVLEKNRLGYHDQQHLSVELKDVVVFVENMDVPAERYEIMGLKGALNVKNDSDTDIRGDLYLYYKYISDDVLYGGITFRTKITDGLKAGELRQVSAAHFDPDNCIILSVTSEDENGL